jgi:hypothetical protein
MSEQASEIVTSLPMGPTRAERDQVVDQLREAVSAGLLTFDEFKHVLTRRTTLEVGRILNLF